MGTVLFMSNNLFFKFLLNYHIFLRFSQDPNIMYITAAVMISATLLRSFTLQPDIRLIRTSLPFSRLIGAMIFV